jgi:hypothetical protein
VLDALSAAQFKDFSSRSCHRHLYEAAILFTTFALNIAQLFQVVNNASDCRERNDLDFSEIGYRLGAVLRQDGEQRESFWR